MQEILSNASQTWLKSLLKQVWRWEFFIKDGGRSKSSHSCSWTQGLFPLPRIGRNDDAESCELGPSLSFLRSFFDRIFEPFLQGRYIGRFLTFLPATFMLIGLFVKFVDKVCILLFNFIFLARDSCVLSLKAVWWCLPSNHTFSFLGDASGRGKVLRESW